MEFLLGFVIFSGYGILKGLGFEALWFLSYYLEAQGGSSPMATGTYNLSITILGGLGAYTCLKKYIYNWSMLKIAEGSDPSKVNFSGDSL